MKTSNYAKKIINDLNSDHFKNLTDNFNLAIKRDGEKIAFSCLGQDITFDELDKLSKQFGAYLKCEYGLNAGERIAIQIPNLIQYPIVAWGAIHAGLVIVNTNPLYTERELLHQFNDSGAKVLVVLADLLGMIEKVVPQTNIDLVISTSAIDMIEAKPKPLSSLKNLISLPDALEAGKSHDLPHLAATMESIAVLQYTGGTTGAPKGAVLTHGNFFASAAISTQAFQDISKKELSISPMPLYHIYGFLVHVISGVLNGNQSVLIPDPRDTDSLISTMKKYPFTLFTGINTLFTSLLEHPEFDTIDFSHLERVVAGGTALIEEIATEWERRTDSIIYEGYGLSETSATCAINTPESRQLGTVGPAMITTQLKVIDADGKELSNGKEGELLIRGPQVMIGYWNRPEATAESLDIDGWFRTGDVAVIQDDGHVRIVDRIKDMIIVSGFNVYPNEVEAVVYDHPDVLECAAIGIADKKTDEAIKLFVNSKNPKLTAEELQQFCRKNLTPYKVPKYIEFLDDLPKSNVGKILRRELRDSH